MSHLRACRDHDETPLQERVPESPEAARRAQEAGLHARQGPAGAAADNGEHMRLVARGSEGWNWEWQASSLVIWGAGVVRSPEEAGKPPVGDKL